MVIVNQAVSDEVAVKTFWIDEPTSAKNTLSEKWVEALRSDDKRFGHTLEFPQRRQILTTTIEHLAIAYGDPFFIKIDVEAHELSVLRGMKRSVPYLSFEVNLPEFRAEGLQCVELLGRLAALENSTTQSTVEKAWLWQNGLVPGSSRVYSANVPTKVLKYSGKHLYQMTGSRG